MDCKKVREELVFLYIDDEMGGEIQIAYREHLLHCAHCAREDSSTRTLIAKVRRSTWRVAAPRRLRERIVSGMPHRLQRQREA